MGQQPMSNEHDREVTIQPVTLTDGSQAYDVHIPVHDADTIVIGATNRRGAQAIANAFNEYAAWIELR